MLGGSLKIVKITDLGITIEDKDMYQVFIDREDLPNLLSKISIALSLPEEKLPIGSDLHPACVVEEFLEENK